MSQIQRKRSQILESSKKNCGSLTSQIQRKRSQILEMEKTKKGKGPGRPKGRKRETSKESSGGADSDTSEILRQRILGENGQEVLETGVGPSGGSGERDAATGDGDDR